MKHINTLYEELQNDVFDSIFMVLFILLLVVSVITLNLSVSIISLLWIVMVIYKTNNRLLKKEIEELKGKLESKL